MNMTVEWQDRARWMGIPILFTRYWMAGETLYRRRGPLWITEDRLPLYRVLDVRVRKSPLDRLLGLGGAPDAGGKMVSHTERGALWILPFNRLSSLKPVR